MSSAFADQGPTAASLYRTKLVYFRGSYHTICMQTVGGPCPLIALVNHLSLRGLVSLRGDNPVVRAAAARDGSADRLSGATLVEVVSDYLRRTHAARAAAEPVFALVLSRAMSVLPTLHAGLDINVRFTDVAAFDDTPALALFALCGVPLLHAWLPSPDDPFVDVISGLTYDRMVLAASGIFLDASPPPPPLPGSQTGGASQSLLPPGQRQQQQQQQALAMAVSPRSLAAVINNPTAVIHNNDNAHFFMAATSTMQSGAAASANTNTITSSNKSGEEEEDPFAGCDPFSPNTMREHGVAPSPEDNNDNAANDCNSNDEPVTPTFWEDIDYNSSDRNKLSIKTDANPEQKHDEPDQQEPEQAQQKAQEQSESDREQREQQQQQQRDREVALQRDLETTAAALFLEDHPQQWTPHGVRTLTRTVPERGLAVLFRNNHFSVIYKVGGVLYALVTSEAMATSQAPEEALTTAQMGFLNINNTGGASSQSQGPGVKSEPPFTRPTIDKLIVWEGVGDGDGTFYPAYLMGDSAAAPTEEAEAEAARAAAELESRSMERARASNNNNNNNNINNNHNNMSNNNFNNNNNNHNMRNNSVPASSLSMPQPQSPSPSQPQSQSLQQSPSLQ